MAISVNMFRSSNHGTALQAWALASEQRRAGQPMHPPRLFCNSSCTASDTKISRVVPMVHAQGLAESARAGMAACQGSLVSSSEI